MLKKTASRWVTFVKWYLHLREVLNTHAQLYVLDESLEECPNVSASYEEYMEWSEQKTTYLNVEWMMCAVLNSDLSSQFHNLSTMVIVDELKERIIAQVRIARFECLDEFLSTKMEENTCL